jgi:hypothetical protein
MRPARSPTSKTKNLNETNSNVNKGPSWLEKLVKRLTRLSDFARKLQNVHVNVRLDGQRSKQLGRLAKKRFEKPRPKQLLNSVRRLSGVLVKQQLEKLVKQQLEKLEKLKRNASPRQKLVRRLNEDEN